SYRGTAYDQIAPAHRHFDRKLTLSPPLISAARRVILVPAGGLRAHQKRSDGQVEQTTARKHLALFEIVTVAARHDNALWRYHHPAAILPLDPFDWTEAGQRPAGGHPIDPALTPHISVGVATIAD